jgi:hypothetical protein
MKLKCLPSPQTEEFEIPYDQIGTICLKKRYSQINDLISEKFW